MLERFAVSINTNAPSASLTTGRHPLCQLRDRQPFHSRGASVRACVQVQRCAKPFDINRFHLVSLA